MTELEEMQLNILLQKKRQEECACNKKKQNPVTTVVGGAMYAVLTLGIGPLFDYMDEDD